MDTEALWQLDRTLFLWLNQIDGPGWRLIFGYGTDLGSGLVLALGLGVGLRAFDPRRFPRNLAAIGLAMLAAGLVVQATKHALPRDRPVKDAALGDGARQRRVDRLPGGRIVRQLPVADPALARIAPQMTVIGPPHRYRAFPSGHTAAAFACAAGLLYAFRSRARWLALLPAGFVGMSRVVCGVHFPSDVLVGALLGAGTSLACLRGLESFHGLRSWPRPDRPRVSGEATRVMWIAGEASADLYAARVLGALRDRDPTLEAKGIGGVRLERAGLDAFARASELEIVGFTAVVRELPRLARLYRRCVAELDAQRPHVLVCIDLPDFNLMLATQARARGIPVLFFVSPQFWAWRPGRLEKIADRISRMIVVLPFERVFYERVGVPVAFHGHPLLEARASTPEAPADEARAPRVVLAPGSRPSEWRLHLDPLLAAAARIRRARPDVRFSVPLAPNAPEALLRQAAARHDVAVEARHADADGGHDALLRSATLGLVCSGTMTLEATLAGLPVVIFYRGSPLNMWLARRLVKIDRIGLPNIVLGGERPVFPELLQQEASGDGLAQAALALLNDPQALAHLRHAAAELRARLEAGPTSERVAEEVLALAERRPPAVPASV